VRRYVGLGVNAFAADTRGTYDDVARLYAPVAVAVFVVIVGAIAFLVWRGRRREAAGGPDERPLVEAAYVAVLAVVVGVLVAVTFHAQGKIESANARPGVDVRVIAAKWNWTFRYPATGAQVTGRPGVPATLVVPAGREVRFSGTSIDVIHGFWIPERRFQRQLIPGRDAHFSIVFPAPGVLDNATCSFFCGLGHSEMRFRVRVLAPAAFDAWLRARGSGA
jgi:cytochrome c oxidase subunit II